MRGAKIGHTRFLVAHHCFVSFVWDILNVSFGRTLSLRLGTLGVVGSVIHSLFFQGGRLCSRLGTLLGTRGFQDWAQDWAPYGASSFLKGRPSPRWLHWGLHLGFILGTEFTSIFRFGRHGVQIGRKKVESKSVRTQSHASFCD